MNPGVIDLFVVLFILVVALDGYRRGFILLISEVLTAIIGFGLAAWITPFLGPFLTLTFGLPSLIQKPITFFALWIIIQSLLNFGLGLLYRFIPGTIQDSLPNKIAGLVPSAAKGVVTAAVLLTLLLILPVPQDIRNAISTSQLGKPLVGGVQNVEQQFLSQYKQEVVDGLTFLTSTPYFPKPHEKGEFVTLNFTTTTVTDDPASEQAMLRKVNEERRKVGLTTLQADPELRAVARAHGRDMFARGYFAHESPEGTDPFMRLQAAGVLYLTAGENLALAPTLDLAHIGLMNSPKHKENILYKDFGKVGIGVIDGGIYGKMFVQEFSD
jgi:uncharacterized protein YkwD